MPKSKKRKLAGKGLPFRRIGTRGINLAKKGIRKYSISPTGVILNRNGAPTIYKK